ncbi:hypothetical protein Nepgr_029299 [Nepenthes gracilis]|uniref:TCP domain-containing protein n=1 Tax=Nepenthes gracilis TaxID=150966 RepID=A0AAD3TEP4_NEPGR|nr:hypothetical protein Nepgr_029299 [Nepenthes gracilis]
MISSSRDEYRLTKKGRGASSSSSSSGSWLRLNDPRIVRVSRASGGKDRHSKVYTARGLRDRRVRLSVPTAIQIYDLQSRLGVNQPSKVVDWLLDAAKQDINELPPLQLPPAEFISSSLFSSVNCHGRHDYHRTGDSVELSRSNLWVCEEYARSSAQDEKEKQAAGVICEDHVPVQADGLLKNFMPQMGFHPLQLQPSSFSSYRSLPANVSASGYTGASDLRSPPPFSLPFGSQLFLSTQQSQASTSDHFAPKGFQNLSQPSSQNLLAIASHAPAYPAGQSARSINFCVSPKLVPSQHAIINGDLLLHEIGEEFTPK